MAEVVIVKRKRQRAGVQDFLVNRPSSKRKICVHILDDHKDMHIHTEFELYWTIVACEQIIAKKGWKHAWIIIRWGNVYCCNISQYKNNLPYTLVGKIESVTDRDHFLNDKYYSPIGFWIE